MNNRTDNNTAAPPPLPVDLQETVDELLQVQPTFHVCDELSANWVVRKIVDARRYAARVKDWAASETRRAQREEEFFRWKYGLQLQAWLDQTLSSRGGKRKSIALPAGTLGRRSHSARLVVVDEVRALMWAKANCPDAAVISEKLSKAQLSRHFAVTGELPGGTCLQPPYEQFYIT